MTMTTATAKNAARTLRADLAESGIAITHARALELVARQLGHRDWNTAAAALDDPRRVGVGVGVGVGIGGAVPMLRIQDEAIARGFYLDYLGFTLEWEHRFAPGMPLYARVRRDAAVLDLSEHHGDGTPGTVVWLPVADVGTLHRELSDRRHPRLRPGVDHDAPGGPTMEVLDPFGNTLRFCQPTT